jgi:parallel beta-helix repeat protein
MSDVVVNVLPGEYFLDSPLSLTEAHSGGGQGKLIIRSAGGMGRAILIGGKRTNPNAWTAFRDGIYVQALPHGVAPHIIYENRRKARKARIPNYRKLKDFPVADGDYFVSGAVGRGQPFITVNKADLNDTLLADYKADLESGIPYFLVVWGHGHADWHKWVYKISDYAPKKGLIFVDEEKPTFHQGNDAKNNRYYIEGGLRLLDAAGEFYFDEKESRLYYMPVGDIRKSEIIYSTMNTMVSIVGGKDIVLDGIKFTCSGVLPFTTSGYTWTDKDAAVSIEKSASIEIVNCHFESIGQSAVNLVSTHQSRIENCLMQYLGQSGIKLYYSDNNLIHNNLIHDIGLRRVYCEGVSIHASKNNKISHLEIYNSARYGITVRGKVDASGKDLSPTTGNVVEYIKIYDVNQDSGDTAGLHMAKINAENGEDYVNFFNQITVTRSIAQPNITDEWKPTGVDLDHKKMVMNQSMKNIEVKDYDPRYKGYEVKRFGGGYGKTDRTSAKQKQIMQNRPWNNESSTKFNCSWQEDFDPSYMEYDKIGLTDAFPETFLRRAIANERR